MDLYSLLIFMTTGIFLGLPTGPSRFFVVGAYIKEGQKAAVKVYLGVFSAMVLYAGVAMLASGFLSRNPEVEDVSYVVGSFLLILWGSFILFKGNKEGGSSIEFGGGSLWRKGFITALSSPVTPFVYLTLIQVLKLISGDTSPWKIGLHLLIAEICSALTIFSIAYLGNKKKGRLNSNWKTAKVVMGTFLIILGCFNLFQLVEVKESGIEIEKKESLLEEQVSQ